MSSIPSASGSDRRATRPRPPVLRLVDHLEPSWVSGSKGNHLTAALQLLAEEGTDPEALLFSASTAARLAGVDRSTIYRHWARAEALDHDLARWACTSGGWYGRLLESHPGVPFDLVVRAILAEPADELGVAIRGWIVGQAPASDVRQEVVDWERGALVAVAEWLDRHVRAQGRRRIPGIEPLDLSIAITAVIEGSLLIGGVRGGPVLLEWTEADTDLVAHGARAMVEALTEPDPSRAPVIGTRRVELADLVGHWPSAKRSIVERIVRGGADSQRRGRPGPQPARLVDPAALSARAGVSTRRLYAIWPAAADFNGDLVELAIREQCAAVDEALATSLAARTERTGVVELVAELCDALVQLTLDRPGCPALGCGPALMDVSVRTRAAAVLGGWHQRQLVHALAAPQVLGADIRPPLGMRQLIDLALGTVAGAQRLAAAHPHVGERRLGRRLGTERSLAFAAGRLVSALTVPR